MAGTGPSRAGGAGANTPATPAGPRPGVPPPVQLDHDSIEKVAPLADPSCRAGSIASGRRAAGAACGAFGGRSETVS